MPSYEKNGMECAFARNGSSKREGCARRVLLVRELRKPKFNHDKVNPPQHLATSSFRNLRQRRVIVIDRKNTQTILTG